MANYADVWEYMQCADRIDFVAALCEEGWEPIAVTPEIPYSAPASSRPINLVHLRRKTGRRVRVSDDR